MAPTAYDQVWEKSDIDLWIVMADDPKVRRYEDHCLTEEGVIIHANLIPRKRFQLNIEGSRQGGWLDFTFAHSTLLFSKDESIAAWYKDAERIGARDRDYQLLRRALPLLATLAKAQKWYQVKKDYNYSFLWLLNVADQLASVECILNGQARAARSFTKPSPSIPSSSTPSTRISSPLPKRPHPQGGPPARRDLPRRPPLGYVPTPT